MPGVPDSAASDVTVSITIGASIAAALLLAVAALVFIRRKAGPPLPDALRVGRPLPDFSALDENRNTVGPRQLRGRPAVLIFVRGKWCPFCTRQVEELTKHFKAMTSLGARLVFITPKPIATTRRVAEFFKVRFDYWLDEDLEVARQLGLLMPRGVPASYAQEYGVDTMWPATLIIDKAGTIRFANLSRLIADRPDPKILLQVLRRLDD